MTIQELISQVNLKVNDTVSDDYWVDRFNECLADLAPVLQLEGHKQTNIDYLTTINLPSDILDDNIYLVSLQNSKQELPRLALNDFESTGYKVFNNTITLQGNIVLPDTLNVWYQRMPTMLSLNNLDAEPEIPAPYQHALKYYAISKWWQTEMEPTYENSYWKDYNDVKNQIAYFVSKRVKRYRDLQFMPGV